MNDFDAGFRVGVEKASSYKENQELRDEIERLRAHIAELEAWQQEGQKLFDNYAVGLGTMFGLGKWWGDRPWKQPPFCASCGKHKEYCDAAEINDLRALCDAKETELYKSHCEIEQLREEKRLRIDFKNMARELTERCDAQAQEIERLVEELKEHDGIVAVWRRRCTEADAEIERLRSDRRASVQQEDALIAEIERLRGLLRDVLLFDVFDYRDEKEMELLGRIREALGNE